jgi:hypothetical protein
MRYPNAPMRHTGFDDTLYFSNETDHKIQSDLIDISGQVDQH